MPPEPLDDIEPDGSLTIEPRMFEEGPADVLTPMGIAESNGSFARSLGPTWIKRVFALGVLAIVASWLAASLV